MKKTGESLLSRWLLSLVILLAACSNGFGQGFYKPIFPGSPISTISPERIISTAGGGFTLPMHDGDHAPLAWTQAGANGNTLATKHTEPSFSQVQAFVVTNDGNYVVLDTTFNDLSPSQHFLKLSWYDFNGTLLLTRNYTIDPLRGYAGNGKLISDDNGNLYVVGLFTNAINKQLYYAIKFDAGGDIIWQLPLSNVNGGTLKINGLTLSKDGSILLDYTPNLGGGRHVFRKDINTGLEWDKLVISAQINMPIAGDATGGTIICEMEKIIYSDAIQSVTWTIDMRTLLNDQSVTDAYYCMAVTGGWVFIAQSNSS
ncbi:MAG: hypothetical protein Q8K92_04110, partial [Leadbetterella sp.]|nr:hypothetical protein [Leadbetterella sp.]